MCRPMWRCMVTEAIRSRMVWVITGVLVLLALLAVCDTLGKGSASGGAAGEEAFLTGRVRVYEETAARGLPDGSMLLAAGMEPGPQLAEALAAARRRALEALWQ